MIKRYKLMSRWLEDENAFFLYSDEPVEKWRALAFSWHAESFYGTFLTTKKIGEQQGVWLSPWEALTFFSSSSENELARLQWDEPSMTFRRWAKAIMDDIRTLQFMPNFTAWKDGGFGWKMEEETEQNPFIKTWRSLAIHDWIQRDQELYEVWQEITNTYPLLINNSSHWLYSEEDWLYEIGWKKDTAPFTVALRLSEPDEENDWKLETLLIAKDNSDTLIWSGEEHLPTEWKEYNHAVQRAHRLWLTAVPWLNNGYGQLRNSLSEDKAWRFLKEASEQLLAAGARIFLPSWWEMVKQATVTMKAKVKSAPKAGEATLGLQTLVDFDWRISTNGVELSEEEFAELVAQKRRLMQIRGQWIQLDPAFIRHVQSLMDQARKEGLPIRDVLQQAFLQQEHEHAESEEESTPFQHISIELNHSFQTFIRQLTHLDEIPSVAVPASFQGTLRPYQQRGVDWLLFLRRFGLGACLADDMGLGKTVQMLAYFSYVKEHETVHKPALLICPTSVLGNWQKECAKFAPSLKIYTHHGPNRAKGETFLQSVREADIVMTSYSLVHLDFAELSSVDWGTICLDEAQNIKNAHTKQARAIRKLKGGHRIALSGTPMENRLTELWSIFDFINPGYLGSLTQFQRRFVAPIEKDRSETKIAMLQKLIRPFLLRRTKNDEAIALDLPDKLEQKEYCPLTAEQASLYEEFVQQTLKHIETANQRERRGLILQMLNRLKQLCDHPALYLKESNPTNVLERSHKLETLLELVQQIRANGESCLIFTQYIQMGEMIQQLLSSRLKENVLFLNGSVTKIERDRMIEQFQAGQFHIFILSLKAGGTGLNLTAANHVIHFDRWWNPAVENQATDRAYRIGQKRFVHVHKLITVGTLEEKIDEMLERKQALNEEIIQSEAWITELSNEELRELLVLPTIIRKGA
ncbi:DEAD/DEAH box helicase [Thermaerobacillus caldiproteolyticus]|uniref:DEAD/DEAH box helicase n=1 Tax=Thermaerobacillus caldiproteolyticus TaxID=247480 RepID=UPI00188C644B|nr:DEAD/DEAH box helicase [Anoxybacillus caldiproteolyticus]QPA30775.1 DEAD/DEAH box helicase [Anoxybacillus caldiproteolyticus]